VADGKADVFDGDLDDYKNWLATQDKPNQPEKPQEKPASKNTYAQNKADRQARLAERRPLVKETGEIEKKLDSWQVEKHAIEQQLADSVIYETASSARLQELLKRQGELAGKIETAELRWLELQGQLEALPTD
jgi:ATP-binding cassette subfamily F protein 3